MILSGIISAMSASESAFYAFDTSDAVGQAIVLILGVGSIATWSIMMDKYLELNGHASSPTASTGHSHHQKP